MLWRGKHERAVQRSGAAAHLMMLPTAMAVAIGIKPLPA